MRPRIRYGLTGMILGLAAGSVLYWLWPRVNLVTVFGAAGMALALLWGEKTRRIQTADEAHRPVTLFSTDPQQRDRH